MDAGRNKGTGKGQRRGREKSACGPHKSPRILQNSKKLKIKIRKLEEFIPHQSLTKRAASFNGLHSTPLVLGFIQTFSVNPINY